MTGLFPVGVDEVWLEIGFGGGEHLVWQARHGTPSPLVGEGRGGGESRTAAATCPAQSRTPAGGSVHLPSGGIPPTPNRLRVGLIGCEPFVDGVIKALSAIEAETLANVRLHPDDARDVLRWLPPASISRAFVLFPDPWPKKRHVKRRLIAPPLLDALARVMKSGAELRLATDIGDYARTSLLAIHAHPQFRWPVRGPADWRERCHDWPETRYERKAKHEGRRCYYFRFIRR